MVVKGNVSAIKQFASNQEFKNILSDNITEWVYNSVGDCVNNLFTGISEITKDKVLNIKDNKTVGNKTVFNFFKKVVCFIFQKS